MSYIKIGKIKLANINLLLVIGGFLAIAFYSHIFYRAYVSKETLISLMIIPVLFGVIFENWRLSSDFKAIVLKILGALLFSTFAFMKGRNEIGYDFENHIERWPYWFIISFVIISIVYHEKKVVPKLTEGITFLQSISIIYWIADIGVLKTENYITYILIGIGIVFSTISFVHAFTYLKLTRNWRLFLSLWSSIIMIVFAIDYIKRVLSSIKSLEAENLNVFFNVIQFFLMGVSLMYIFQNALMLLTYLPDRYTGYGKSKRRDIIEMNITHIERYSNNQIKIFDAILALIFTGVIYYCNYSLQIMPRHTLIWLMFLILPFVIIIKTKLLQIIKR